MTEKQFMSPSQRNRFQRPNGYAEDFQPKNTPVGAHLSGKKQHQMPPMQPGNWMTMAGNPNSFYGPPGPPPPHMMAMGMHPHHQTMSGFY